MPKFICILLITLPLFLNGQSSSIEEMEGHLYAAMDLFEDSIKELKAQHAVELNARELEISNLQAELKEQIDLNYELKAQILSQNIVSANPIRSSREVASNLGRGRGRGAGNPPTESQVEVPPDQMVDINSATMEEFLELPGMNEPVAERIIGGRPWTIVEDLLTLQGIGQMRWSRFGPYMKIEPATEDSRDKD